jgi:hypothetical protein
LDWAERRLLKRVAVCSFDVLGSVRHDFFICINQTGTATSSPDIRTPSPTIINVMLWMKRNAYEDTTIKATAKRLKHLQKNCTLADPEIIKTFVANKKCGNAFKESLIEAYAIYIRSIGQTWNQPFYARYDKLPKIPTEEKINMIIANAGTRMALILSMTKDLGPKPIELTWLKRQDIDLTTGLVSITGAKHTVGRDGKLRPDRELLREKEEREKKHNSPDC